MDLESVIGEFQETFEGQTFPDEISRRFHVTERLGISEFGETFLMSEKDGGELFVLKRCRKSDATMANEADILRGLKHEGLPVYESVIESDTEIFVSRRYIKGITLAEYIEKGDTADKELIVDTMIALCGILEFLHSRPTPIIHRDIKPSNIIINPEKDDVSLIDFGISRKYSENSGTDTMCLGTRNFAPPEQYGFAQTDCRSDIYSLGVVLRYWLTGSSGRYAETDDKALAAIVAKCTMLDPRMRYRNVAALKKALVGYKRRVKWRAHAKIACVFAACFVVAVGLFAAGHANRRGAIIPGDPPPAASGEIRNTTARELVGGIGAGWTLGNTFDAHNLRWLGDNLAADITALETAWLGPGNSLANVTTQALIAEVNRAGFNAIRIPVTWTKVADPANDWAIRADWLERVEEVVGWAYDLGMHIVLNTHNEYDPVFNQMVSNPEKSRHVLTRIWKQIAGRFNNQFGERLVFNGLDKPRIVGGPNEWTGGTPAQHAAINGLNQVFVDAVRATGGNNAYRVLMLATHAASAANNALNGFALPTDSAPDRLVLSIYTIAPIGFTFRQPGTDTWSETGSGYNGPEMIEHYFGNIARRAAELGDVPVILKEWGSQDRANTGYRAAHAEFFVREATARGWPTFWWDNQQTISNGGANEGYSVLFGLIDRRTHEWHFPEIVDAIMRGAGVNP